jgi:organic radical activating enzyme
MEAKIAHIFKGIQGEGRYAGALQTFIRFFGCNLHCKYCDTKLTRFKRYTFNQLRRKVILNKVKFLSLTGGEPLLQANFLREFLCGIDKEGFKIYLETNATLYKNLKQIIDFVDIISFDLKLASSTRQHSVWSLHERFFKAAESKEVFFKTVITSTTELRDIKTTAQFMGDKPGYTLYLQPDSRRLNNSLLKSILYFQEYLLDKKIDVRVLPQVHKFLKIL